MSKVSVDKRKVDAVVEVATKSVAYQVSGLHALEAIIGFAEVTGRAIAAQKGTSILHQELMRVAVQHIENTIRASYGQSEPIVN